MTVCLIALFLIVFAIILRNTNFEKHHLLPGVGDSFVFVCDSAIRSRTAPGMGQINLHNNK
ncbi:MAG: hypothetical protein Q4D20_05235 [Clostridia bacterium]|nr:hypothetical protein [Clostridia bacterium]